MKNRNLSLLCVAVMLCACSGGDGGGGGGAAPPTGPGTSSPSPSAPAPAPAVRIIDNEDTSIGLKGADANSNGVRDDVDRLIAQKYSATPAMKKAAEQEAKAIQLFMEATTNVQVRVAGNATSRSEDCLLKSASDAKTYESASKEIEALTANTQERFAAYWDANKLAGGMVFSQAAEPVCD